MGQALSAAQRAVLALRDMVMSGDLAPGERLYEAGLAENLGLSRTPVREALMHLAQEGLLAREGASYSVRAFTEADVIDAIELRGVVEGTAARLAAERGISAAMASEMRGVLSGIDGIVSAGAHALDFGAYIAGNAAFHALLSQLCGSDLIAREAARATRLPFASPSSFLRVQQEVQAFRESLIEGQRHHRAIFEAIEAREGARAEALTREHARLARRNLEYVMRQDQSLIARVPGLVLVAPSR
ncbi:MAG: GntR family transcriptional regulator [Paracoccaceae bacterium]